MLATSETAIQNSHAEQLYWKPQKTPKFDESTSAVHYILNNVADK